MVDLDKIEQKCENYSNNLKKFQTKLHRFIKTYLLWAVMFAIYSPVLFYIVTIVGFERTVIILLISLIINPANFFKKR